MTDTGGRPIGRWLALGLAISLTTATVEGFLLARSTTEQTAASPVQGTGLSQDRADVVATSSSQDLTYVISTALRSVLSIQASSTRYDPFGGTSEVTGEASGVILAEGLVITNHHVIANATEITVTFEDGETAEASVLGSDADLDLAVLSVPTGDRPAIEVGTSSSLQLGETVVALGYPLGLGITATAGIVSGLDRSIDVTGPNGVEHLDGLLQTDAAINSGNSGGPLIDSSGALVGINTAGASAASAENIGFAIAIDRALPLIREVAGTS
jgi:serine protease Do